MGKNWLAEMRIIPTQKIKVTNKERIQGSERFGGPLAKCKERLWEVTEMEQVPVMSLGGRVRPIGKQRERWVSEGKRHGHTCSLRRGRWESGLEGESPGRRCSVEELARTLQSRGRMRSLW